ncbi:hypothetical protein quinque_011549 [Culex quinquefasciatus]
MCNYCPNCGFYLNGGPQGWTRWNYQPAQAWWPQPQIIIRIEGPPRQRYVQRPRATIEELPRRAYDQYVPGPQQQGGTFVGQRNVYANY